MWGTDSFHSSGDRFEILRRSLFVVAFVVTNSAVSQTPISITTTAPTPTTTGRCDAFFPPFGYKEDCSTVNSFTLPNGRFVDMYQKFCDCFVQSLRAQWINCVGAWDSPFPECNTDGTHHCTVGTFFDVLLCVNNRGGWLFDMVEIFRLTRDNTTAAATLNANSFNCTKESFCEPACIRYSKELRRFQNVGNCSCTSAQHQQMDSTLSAQDNYVPQCNADGSWQKRQSGYGGSWCVDANGNPTRDISFDATYPPLC